MEILEYNDQKPFVLKSFLKCQISLFFLGRHDIDQTWSDYSILFIDVPAIILHAGIKMLRLINANA